MADEIRRVITVDVSDSVENLDELREKVVSAGYSFSSLKSAKSYIDKLRASLIDLDETSEEYAERVDEIDKVQEKLNKAMKATSDSTKDAEGSYNALSKTMSELKKAFKATHDEAEREVLEKKIVGINDQLKEMDASIGNYQRNVGNYETAFTKGLSGIADKIQALGNPLAIAKNGVLALGNAMKAQEWIASLLNKIGIVSDEQLEIIRQTIESQKEAIRTTEELTDREIALTERKRKFMVEEAKAGEKIAELRNKAINKEQYTAKERYKFLTDALAKEKKINDEKLAIAEEEYAIIKKRSELTDNDAATNDELAAAEANVHNVRKEHYEKEREMISQRIAAAQELSAAEKKNLEESEKNTKKEDELKKEALKRIEEIQYRAELSLMSAKDRELKILEDKYKEELALLEKYEKDSTKLTAEYEAKEQDIINKNGKNEANNINKRAIQSLMGETERQLAILKDKYNKEKKLLEDNGVETVNLTKEYMKRVAEIKAGAGEGEINEINDNSTLERDIADKTIQNEFDKKEKLLKIDRERLLGQKKIYEELYNLDGISEEKKQEYADKIKQIDADLAENSRQLTQLKKEEIMSLLNTYSQVAQGIGNLMNTVSSIWQASIKERVKNGKITEEQGKKEFESTKKLQIAAAIVNGLAGVATAVSTAMSLGPILGPIMAAVNSALVITTTSMQISKIKSTTFDGGGGGSMGETSAQATPTPAAMEYVPNYQANVTGDSETVNLANAVNEGKKDQRVYLVESDVQEAGKRVEVREAETTF